MVAGAVGYMARAADGGGRAAELVTRDFLGGCVAADDARDAAAATARHDAVSGKVSLQKQVCPATPRDLNLFPVPGAAASAAKPCTSTAAAAPSAGGTTTYHSVCTIEKVKTALERFERGKHGHHQHQQQHSAGASPSSSSVTTSSVKRRGAAGGSGMVAAACPRCFLYVLISRSDPRCPRCESHVPPPPSPAPKKKPRIDLNVGFLGT
uniref:GIR1-like zinc ribbon domain-containing protein n=1 Tax=Oryza brachyantha TaxID=4533 RepID=J3LRC3_ORYBR